MNKGIKKTDEEIIDLLILDTKRSKLKWVTKDDTITSKKINVYGSNVITTIMTLSDELVEDEELINIYGYSAEFSNYITQNVISLDIYMNKNGKKNIFCRRIIAHQLKLSDLIMVIYAQNNSDK